MGDAGAGPGARDPVAEFAAERVQPFAGRVDAIAGVEQARARLRDRLALAQRAQRVELGLQVGVGHAADAQALGVLREQGAQRVALQPSRVPGLHRQRRRRARRQRALAQHYFIAVAAEFVAIDAALGLDVDRGDVRQGLRQPGEELWRDQQFLFRQHGLLDAPLQARRIGVGVGLVQLDRGGEAALQVEMAHVAEVQRAARGQQRQRLHYHVVQVLGVGEVLQHRVDHDQVEAGGAIGRAVEAGQAVAESLHPVRRPRMQFDLAGQLRLRGDLAAQALHGRRRQVGAVIGLDPGRDLGQDQAAADADFQHPPRLQLEDAPHRLAAPFAHLLQRDLAAVVAAVPAVEALAERGGVEALLAVQGFVDGLPLVEQAGLLAVVALARVAFEHHVADQLAVAGAVFARDHDRLRHRRVALQGVLDLAELDAEAAQLDLVVDPAEELQLAVGAPAGEVAAAVHALAFGEGIGDEALGAEPGTMQVAARQAAAGEIQLAGHADRHRPQAGVEQVYARADHRRADRRLHRARQRRAHARAHRGLGRAVGIGHAPALRPLLDQLRRAGLAGDDQVAAVGQRVGAEHRQRRRRQGGVADPVPAHQFDQRIAGQQLLGVAEHQRRARQQRHAQFPERRVEAQRGELQDPRARADLECADLAREQARHAGMADHHALRPAGRAGGVDHIGRVQRRAVGEARRIDRLRGQHLHGLRQVQQPARHAVLGQARLDLAPADQARRTGVGQHVGQALGRVVRVQRQVGGAGLEDAEHRDDHLRRTRQSDRHEVLAADAVGDQRMGEAVGAAVELGVAQHGIAVQQRRRIGLARDLALEQPGHGRVGAGVERVAVPALQ